jgi:hypothetical protein
MIKFHPNFNNHALLKYPVINSSLFDRKYAILSSFYSAPFLLGGSSIPNLNTVESPLGYVTCFLNLSFDVKSVICRLHNLRSPFKISFYLVPPIVFSFMAHAFCYLGPYAAFHEMALTCHIEGSMITAIWTHLRMFQNSKFYQFMLNVEFCLGRC